MESFAVPNLDAMTRADLGRFVDVAEEHRNLWGKRKGGVRATELLRSYALLRASVLTYRESREPDRAAHDEAECHRVRAELPEWARW